MPRTSRTSYTLYVHQGTALMPWATDHGLRAHGEIDCRRPGTPRGSGLGRMNGRDEPADPAAEGSARQHVRGKMLAGRDPECRHPHRARIEEDGVPRPVR